MENGDLEERLNKVEDELAKPENQLKTGQIVVRLFRYWLTEYYLPHVQREEKYLWGARVMLAALLALAGVITWALDTINSAISILKIGSGGP